MLQAKKAHAPLWL